MAKLSAETVLQEVAESNAYAEAVSTHLITGFDCSFKNLRLERSGEGYEVVFAVPLHEGEHILELVAHQQRILHLAVARKKHGVEFPR